MILSKKNSQILLNKNRNLKTNDQSKQHISRNHKTLVVLVGGMDTETMNASNKLYYFFSDDINNNDCENVWRESAITLPFPIYECECTFTDINSENPTLVILGGINDTNETTEAIHWELSLSEIIGRHKLFHLYFDYSKVK